ncbi:MAG: 30S ribosomal protein S20 [Myxococcota bacterium]
MANTRSAKKAARQAEDRRVRNLHYKRTMRTKVKKVREALAAGDVDVAKTALGDAVRYIDRVASKGIIMKRTASRKISRLSKAVHGLSTSA